MQHLDRQLEELLSQHQEQLQQLAEEQRHLRGEDLRESWEREDALRLAQRESRQQLLSQLHQS